MLHSVCVPASETVFADLTCSRGDCFCCSYQSIVLRKGIC